LWYVTEAGGERTGSRGLRCPPIESPREADELQVEICVTTVAGHTLVPSYHATVRANDGSYQVFGGNQAFTTKHQVGHREFEPKERIAIAWDENISIRTPYTVVVCAILV
jgi:hypothetical protein